MQFKATYNYLVNKLGVYNNDLPYRCWNSKPQDTKACYLYINFFQQIQFAWYKAGFSYVDECEAVSIVLQYLLKNVPKIENNSKRYSNSYIYQVAFNCIRSLHWRKRDRNRNEYEVSSVLQSDGEEFDILAISTGDQVEDYNTPQFEYDAKDLFDVVASMGCEYDKLAHSFICDGMNLRRYRRGTKTVFSDVSVNQKNVESMKREMRKILVEYVKEHRPDLQDYVNRLVSEYIIDHPSDMVEFVG